ncbi:hypothetical protein, partial [Lysinibacillus xylanilyticus]|uniref:hypothetical protein n=1 Tax=Lysinibacillus xylanilyticus TaxID=582475 RepID=UPI0037F1712C
VAAAAAGVCLCESVATATKGFYLRESVAAAAIGVCLCDSVAAAATTCWHTALFDRSFLINTQKKFI